MTDQRDWIRHGECNQCGDCCRQATNCVSLLVPIPDEAYGRIRYGKPVVMVGAQDAPPTFHIRGPVYLPCPKLDGDRCSIHETKPAYCRETPCAPEDIEGLPRCSYWFVHRVTGEIRAGSPEMLAALTLAQQELERQVTGDAVDAPRGIVGHSPKT